MANTPSSEFKVKISAVNTATAAFDKAVTDFERAAAAGKDTTTALARVAKAFQQLEANGNATAAVLERGAQALARAEEATAAAAEAAKAHAEALAKEREEAEASEKGFRGLLNNLKELQELGEKTAAKGGLLGGLGGAALNKGVGHAAKAGFGQIIGFAAESVAAYRGVSAVLDTVKEGIEDGIKNNNEYERSVLRIQNTLKNTGSIAGVSAGQIAELTEGLEKTTFISKMQAQSMQGRLLQSPNLRGEQYEKALRTSADLSEQLQIDPEQAATLLTRASEHPTDALKMLKRQGLNVSDTDVEDLKKTEATQGVTAAFEQLEKVINRIAGGAAEAAHQGAAGSVDTGNKGVEAFWMNVTGGAAGRAAGRGYADFGQGLAWLSDSKLRADAARTRGNADALLSGNYSSVKLEGNNAEQREQLEQVENLLKAQKQKMLDQYAALPAAPDAQRQHAREVQLGNSTERYHAAGEQIEELKKARSGDDPQTQEANRQRDENDLTRIVQESADERDKIVKTSSQTQSEAYRTALVQIAADEKAAAADSGGNAGKIVQGKSAADAARASVTKNYVDSINKADGSDALERELAVRKRINDAVRDGSIPQSQAAQALKDQLDISQKLLDVNASAAGQVRERLSLLMQQNEAAEKQSRLMAGLSDMHAETLAKVSENSAYSYTLATTGNTKEAERAARDARTRSQQDDYVRTNNLTPDSPEAQANWKELQTQNASDDARSQQDEATAATQARTKAVEDFRNAQQRTIDTNNAEIAGLEANGRASDGVTARIKAYADIEKQIATLKRENKGLSDGEIADMRSLGERAADTAEKLQKLKAAQEFLASINPNVKLGQDAKKNQDLVGTDGITQAQVDAANLKKLQETYGLTDTNSYQMTAYKDKSAQIQGSSLSDADKQTAQTNLDAATNDQLVSKGEALNVNFASLTESMTDAAIEADKFSDGLRKGFKDLWQGIAKQSINTGIQGLLGGQNGKSANNWLNSFLGMGVSAAGGGGSGGGGSSSGGGGGGGLLSGLFGNAIGGAESTAAKALGEDKGTSNPAGQSDGGDAKTGAGGGQGKGAAAGSAVGGFNDLLTGIVNDVVGHDADADAAKAGKGGAAASGKGGQSGSSKAGTDGTGINAQGVGGGTGGSPAAPSTANNSGSAFKADTVHPAASQNLKDLQAGTGAGGGGAAGKTSNAKNDVGQTAVMSAAQTGTLGGSLTWQKVARFVGIGNYDRQTGKLSFGNQATATAGGVKGQNHTAVPSNADNNYHAPQGAQGAWSSAQNAEVPSDLPGGGAFGGSTAASAPSGAAASYIDAQGHFNPDGVGATSKVAPIVQTPTNTAMQPSPMTAAQSTFGKPLTPEQMALPQFDFAGSFASGGTMFAGQNYLTGERGPEPIFARQAGYVLSHSDARKAMSGAATGGTRGGGAVTNITVNTPDVSSFKASQTQIMGKASAAMNRART